MDATLIKMLETAFHPSTDEHTRANAFGLIEGKVRRAGGVEAALTSKPKPKPKPKANAKANDDHYWFDRYSELQESAKERAAEMMRLRDERDLFAKRFFKLASAMRDLTVEDNDLEDPAIALYGALGTGWRTLGDLCRYARANGFRGAENTLRKRADILANAGKIEVREAGYHTNAYTFEGRAWRIKP